MLIEWKPPEGAPPDKSPASGFDIAGAAFRSTILANNESGNAFAMNEAYNELLDEVHKKTGKRLRSPVDAFLEGSRKPLFWEFRGDPEFAAKASETEAEIAKLTGENPELADLRNRAGLAAVQTRADTLSRESEERTVAAMEGHGAGGIAASIIGSLPAALVDPTQFAANFIGIGGSRTVIGAAVRSGIENAAADALTEPGVQSRRRAIGLPSGLEHAAQNVALSALLGVTIGGSIKAGELFVDDVRAPARAAKADAAMVAARAKAGGAALEAAATGDAGAAAKADRAIREALQARDEAFVAKSFAESRTGRGVRRFLDGSARVPTSTEEAATPDSHAADLVPAGANPEIDANVAPLARKAEALDIRDGASLATTPEGLDIGEAVRALDEADGYLRELTDEPPEAPLMQRPASKQDERAALMASDETPRPASGAVDYVAGKPRRFMTFDPRDIGADPARFQYKASEGPFGVTGRLAGVEVWDPASSGKVFVYEDASGERWIADGHQRLAKAKELMAGGRGDIALDGFLYREKDGWTARDVRIEAAKKNLRESPGDPIDIATLLREAPDALDTSVPQAGSAMKIGRGLAQLSPEALSAARAGIISAENAAVIGRVAGDRPELHMALVADFARDPPANPRVAEFLVRQGMAAVVRDQAAAQLSLFGDTLITGLRARADILSRAMMLIGDDKRAFTIAEANAPALEAAGNRLAHEANQRKRDLAGALRKEMMALATRAGPVADALKAITADALENNLSAVVAARRFADEAMALLEERGLRALKSADPPSLPPATTSPVGPVEPHIEVHAEAKRLEISRAQTLDDESERAALADVVIRRALAGEKAAPLPDDAVGAAQTFDWRDIQQEGAAIELIAESPRMMRVSELEDFDPVGGARPWDLRGVDISEESIRAALASGATMKEPFRNEPAQIWSGKEHGDRIATLMRDGWKEPIELGRDRDGELFIKDGYHRLAAAILRGDKEISVLLPSDKPLIAEASALIGNPTPDMRAEARALAGQVTDDQAAARKIAKQDGADAPKTRGTRAAHSTINELTEKLDDLEARLTRAEDAGNEELAATLEDQIEDIEATLKVARGEGPPRTFTAAAEAAERVEPPLVPFDYDYAAKLLNDLEEATVPELKAIVQAYDIAPGQTLKGANQHVAAILEAWRSERRIASGNPRLIDYARNADLRLQRGAGAERSEMLFGSDMMHMYQFPSDAKTNVRFSHKPNGDVNVVFSARGLTPGESTSREAEAAFSDALSALEHHMQTTQSPRYTFEGEGAGQDRLYRYLADRARTGGYSITHADGVFTLHRVEAAIADDDAGSLLTGSADDILAPGNRLQEIHDMLKDCGAGE